MRRVILALCALLLILALAPGAAASKPQIDYKPVEIGDMFRNQEATPDLIENLGEAPAGGHAAAAASSAQVGIAGVGEQKSFLLRTPTGYAFTTFTLRGISDHGEVWVQNNLNFPAGDPRNPVVVTDDQVAHLLHEFDTNMYPIESAFWTTPDVHLGENALLSAWGYVPENYYASADGVDRVVILVSNIRDENYADPTYPSYIAGFYSSTFEAYFDRNVMSIDAYDWGNRVGPNNAPWRPNDGPENDRSFLYEGTFAHEYQHLLHDDIDSDEDSWINEGMSDFAEYLTGYSHLDTDGHINNFLERPYNSLTNWEDRGPLEILADYGAAYLFQLYLNQNYGQDFIKALAWNKANGIAGVDATLAEAGHDATFAGVYRDWATAVLVNGKNPRYSIQGLSKRINLDDQGDSGPDALPWGPNYIRIPAQPKITNLMIEGIQFLGTPWSVEVDPADAANPVLFGGGSNLADNMAILPVDLTGQTGSILNFKTMYEIEEHWDFGMVQVSTDNGHTWTTLSNAMTTADHDPNAHPDIIANLPGLTGSSGGWVDLSYDLSAYDGQQILLAFRYMTDWATLETGWYVDDIEVGGMSHDGSTLEGFQGIDEVLGRFAEYMITFVGKKRVGRSDWQVMHLDMQTFTEDTQKELKKFMGNASLDEVIMVVTYAAPDGTTSSVPIQVEVQRRTEVQSKKK